MNACPGLPGPSFAQERRIRSVCAGVGPASSLAKTVPVLCELPEVADPDLLSHVVRTVVRRHPALRHRFVLDGAGTRQEGIRLEPVTAQIADLECEYTEYTECAEYAERHVRARVDTAFDVLGWPLLRFGLVDGPRPLLYLCADHLVIDGGSALHATREVERLYYALLTGRADPLPPACDFLAHSAAQRRRYAPGPTRQAQTRGLLKLLDGRPVQPPFPVEASWDLARGRYVSFDLLDADQTAGLTELCRTWRVTPFMAVLAAFGVATRELSGAAEAGILVAIHNREEPPARDGIGWYANMLPLYFPAGRQRDFAAAARQVRGSLMELMPYHELPLALLQDAVPGGNDGGDDGNGTVRPTCFMSYVDARDDEMAARWRQIDFAPAHRVGHGIWVVRRRGGLRAHVACPHLDLGEGQVAEFEARIAAVLREALP